MPKSLCLVANLSAKQFRRQVFRTRSVLNLICLMIRHALWQIAGNCSTDLDPTCGCLLDRRFE